MNKILNILESFLGSSHQVSDGEYSFYCPSCKHHKRKLQVNIDETSDKFGNWSCWVCRYKNSTKGKSLISLAQKFGSANDILKIKKLKSYRSSTSPNVNPEKRSDIIKLPENYIFLPDANNSISKISAINYLKSRLVLNDDIYKYRIGISDSLEWKNRIIFPSYDSNGFLNYFVSRSYFVDDSTPYKMPHFSKDIIFNEVNINFSMPIILVEGIFDMLRVRINAIPLLGKEINSLLWNRIIENRPPVYVYLDADAMVEAILNCYKLFKEGIITYLVIPPKNTDPGSLSVNENLNVIKNAVEVTESELIKYMLKYNVNNHSRRFNGFRTAKRITS